MTKLNNKLSKLVSKYGIAAVISEIANNHSDKVYIPSWYYQEHLESIGFEFNEVMDLEVFNQFMLERSAPEFVEYAITDDYPELWAEFVEEQFFSKFECAIHNEFCNCKG